jgi:hypothetical protein
MNKKELTKIQATVDMCEELSSAGRQELIMQLLRQQKRLSNYENKDLENCTLIDLRKGIIVGSSICPTCMGWRGRDLDYLEDVN